MTKNTEIQVPSSSSKASESDAKGTELAELRKLLGERPPAGIFDPPLPICRKCKQPVLWMRIQPDVTRGELKVTVGCRPHGGDNPEPTDTFWITLQQLQEAMQIDPGEAF
jgi:hypothetical protein